MSEARALFDDAAGTAQQIVTALLHGDRDTAGDLVENLVDDGRKHLAATLALAELVAYTHVRWAESIGAEPTEAWAALMVDTEEWRGAR